MREYILQNYGLICISLGMIIISVQGLRRKDKNALYPLCIVLLILVLSVIVHLNEYAINEYKNIMLATALTFFGYVIRPICVYLFIRFVKVKHKYSDIIILVLLSANFFIYVPSLFINVEWMRNLCFNYEMGETALIYNGGPLRFVTHIVSLLLILYLLYSSVSNIRDRFKEDSYAVIVCAVFVIVAVVLESFTDFYKDILNITIAISCVFYYLFLFSINTKRDALTGLFDRKTYYIDVKRYQKKISFVMLVDMNRLKYYNDTFGHEAGDVGLKAVCDSIMKSLKRNMYAYRIGGDEFVVLFLDTDEVEVLAFAESVKEKLSKTEYSASLGYSSVKDDNERLDVSLKEAEKGMYKDKAKYYSDNKLDRRRAS